MKKLLSCLLTLLLCVCVINSNNKKVKAVETATLTDILCFGLGSGAYATTYGLYTANPYDISTRTPISDGDKTAYGINQINNYEYEFSKNLIALADTQAYLFRFPGTTATDSYTFTITDDLEFKFNTSVSNDLILIQHTNGFTTLTLKGNGHTLKLSGDNSLYTGGQLILDNIHVEAIASADGSYAIQGLRSLQLKNNATLTLKNTSLGADSKALDVLATPIMPGASTVQGSSSPTGALQEVRWDTGDRVYKTLSGDDVKLLKLVAIDPPPSAATSESASIKDESCEAVIGPSWHWNNDLGVCEEYAIISTSTRKNSQNLK